MLPQGTKYDYTGNAVEPAVSVTYKGKQISYNPSSTFSLIYEDNLKSGTAKVTVKGVGNLNGEKTLTFAIKAKLVNPVPSGAKFSRQTKDEGTSWYGYHDINQNVTGSTPVYAITSGIHLHIEIYKNGNHIDLIDIFPEKLLLAFS